MKTHNKGEWSELYVFFKLLSEGRLFAANSDLEKLPELYYPILAILREEGGQNFEYRRDSEIKIIDESTGKEIAKFTIDEFIQLSRKLLDSIKNGAGNFQVEWLDDWLVKLKIVSLKASSQNKTDILIKVLDRNTNLSPIVGFSIKSKIGSASTLFNASGATNFVFKIEVPPNFDPTKVNQIEEGAKLKLRFKRLLASGCKFHFVGMDNKVFEGNLMMIDYIMPRILAEVLLTYNCNFAGSSLSSILESLNQRNPLGYNLTHGHPYYEHKLKEVLTEFALGLKPATVWNGDAETTGGFIIVKENGELVCYHIYNRNDFKEYLLKDTKLDTPSTRRHGFGKVYKVGSEYFIKLNLQIRYTA